ILVFLGRGPLPWWARVLALAATLLVWLWGVFGLFGFFTHLSVGLEEKLAPNPQTFRAVPKDRMYPLTGTSFFLAGSAMLALLRWQGRRSRGVAASLAFAGALLNLVIVLGYLYGTPLLYGGSVIPVALTTALAFIFLGVGLIAAAGPDQ